MKMAKPISIFSAVALIIFSAGICKSEQSVALYLELFEKGKDQTVKVYDLDTLAIERGGAMFHFGPGQLVMLDFGWDKPSAMLYRGEGRFVYAPPNPVEYQQLYKFKNEANLDRTFKTATLFFTIPLENLPDVLFESRPMKKDEWEQFSLARDKALSHLYLHLPSKLLDDLVSEGDGKFFYADFDLKNIGNLAFVEDPTQDDWYRIYEIKRAHGILMADVLGGFSPDDRLPSGRGVQPVDIIHYDIEPEIQADGDMTVKCRITYVPLITGRRFLYFDWFYENRLFDAFDSQRQNLIPIYKKEVYKILDEEREESGIGLVLNQPTVAGDTDYVEINYECECLRKQGALYYIRSETRWYPRPEIRDLSRYTINFTCADKYEVVCSGNRVEERTGGGKRYTRFEITGPAEYVSFNVGTFRRREMAAEGFTPVTMFLAEEIADASVTRGRDIDEQRKADEPYSRVSDSTLITVEDTSHVFLASKDRIGQTGADMLNSMVFFASIFGQPPFDTIKVTGSPYTGWGQSSAGLIHLAWDTFLDDDLDGWDESFRAGAMALQWWGNTVGIEGYRDDWIIKGLAQYCGLWFYEMSVQNRGALEKMMRDMREEIVLGRGPSNAEKGGGFQILPVGTGQKSVGSQAGSITLGKRLSSSSSDDYYELAYFKGAYIIHMIRYLLHDYKTGSDDRFAFFLQDLIARYRNKPITTAALKELLEGHVGGDMTWFFDQWVYGTEIPRYEFSYVSTPTRDGKYSVTCKVVQRDVTEGFKMIVPVTVLFEGDKYIHFRVWVTRPEEEIELPVLPYEPKKVLFNTYDAVLGDVK